MANSGKFPRNRPAVGDGTSYSGKLPKVSEAPQHCAGCHCESSTDEGDYLEDLRYW